MNLAVYLRASTAALQDDQEASCRGVGQRHAHPGRGGAPRRDGDGGSRRARRRPRAGPRRPPVGDALAAAGAGTEAEPMKAAGGRARPPGSVLEVGRGGLRASAEPGRAPGPGSRRALTHTMCRPATPAPRSRACAAPSGRPSSSARTAMASTQSSVGRSWPCTAWAYRWSWATPVPQDACRLVGRALALARTRVRRATPPRSRSLVRSTRHETLWPYCPRSTGHGPRSARPAPPVATATSRSSLE